ncbi:MAG TPA: hypothetical protein VKK31_13525 [Thermoanaerobaculia bacterium]|nr:hypothetical protein [Thermoanaerobaculia bacterium]
MKGTHRAACTALLILNIALPAVSQTGTSSTSNTSNNGEFSLGTARTAAEAAAVKFLARFAEGLPDIYETSKSRAKEDKGWILDLSPDISIETGDKDSFNGVIAKMTGNYMRIRLTELPGIPQPIADSNKLIHVVPVSFGFEGNRNFDDVAAILETGYIPMLIPKGLGFMHKVGIFLQAGYKFDASKDGEQESGGAEDQSAEEPDTSILRLKTSVGTKWCLLGNNGGCLRALGGGLGKGDWSVNVLLDASGWYDIANQETYHLIDARLRLTLKEARNFDLKYQDGSGAPNFNKGDEFSANLTIGF